MLTMYLTWCLHSPVERNHTLRCLQANSAPLHQWNSQADPGHLSHNNHCSTGNSICHFFQKTLWIFSPFHMYIKQNYISAKPQQIFITGLWNLRSIFHSLLSIRTPEWTFQWETIPHLCPGTIAPVYLPIKHANIFNMATRAYMARH